MARVETIIGDLNYCGGSKKRRLGEFIEEQNLDDIGRIEHTHEWGAHRCRIDRVLTKEKGRPWFFVEGLECKSDHTIVAAKVKTKGVTIKRRETNWDAVTRHTGGRGGQGRTERGTEMGTHRGPVRRTKGSQQVMGERGQGVREE